jgi:hypothetical protein
MIFGVQPIDDLRGQQAKSVPISLRKVVKTTLTVTMIMTG